MAPIQNSKRLKVSDSQNRPAPETPMMVPISELPLRFRPIFPYVSFNLVQSMVFNEVIYSNKPIIVSAPTGAGKTGVFELAVVKVIMDYESRPLDYGLPKIVYLAPTKALCAERREDWSRKFKEFNIVCEELTSDMTGPVNFRNSKKSSILLATPEKWDSITRSWSGSLSFIQSIRLLLVDEVHLVNDGHRGATLEAVISRMKTIREQIWPTEPDNLRFVAVSATVSNVSDLKDWLSTEKSIASIFQVHPNQRPVKLRTIVLGYNPTKDDFQFDNGLNHKLASIVKEYSNNKPTMIFCATRRSSLLAATTLVKEGKFEFSLSAEKRHLYLDIAQQFRDKTLQETARYGIAFHNAGLCQSDRKLIESGFLDGHIMILCSTSTLALGVNLPAHLVIIKNTFQYDEGQFKPYSESSLVQMIGRAGRPQFDTEATAVIMTKTTFRDSIEKMLTGNLVVDSQLHKFLTEHINSEIVLGTITDVDIARKWIDATFLRVRLMKNPENYGLKATSKPELKNKTLINWCNTGIDKLLNYRMIKKNEQGRLESTEPGKAMARHYICLETMVTLVQLKGYEKLIDLLNVICASHEVANDVQIRMTDKSILKNMCEPKDERHRLRFVVPDPHTSRQRKACVLIQATFGNVTFSDNTIYQESLRIVKNATRVMNCLKDICLSARTIKYSLIKNVLILGQCFMANLWEDSIYVSKQLEKIGAILSHNLANNGLTTFERLRKAIPQNIEMFCNRNPPFGVNVQRTCFGLPIYELNVDFKVLSHDKEKVQLIVEVKIANGRDMRQLQSLPKCHESTLIVGNLRDNKLLLKQQVTDTVILNRPDLTFCFGAEIDKVELPNELDDIEAIILSEMFVGLNVQKIVKYKEPEIFF